MNSRAQGSLEYLLLIGGAILISAVVITLLTTLGGSGGTYANNAEGRFGTEFNELFHSTGGGGGATPCPGGDTDCPIGEYCSAGTCTSCNNSCNGSCQSTTNCTSDPDCDSPPTECQGNGTCEPTNGECNEAGDCDGPDIACCGNSSLDSIIGETCDDSLLGGENCISQGFTSGTLGCLNDCTGFNTTNCVGSVTCDGGFPDGTCDALSEDCSCIDCEREQAACNPAEFCYSGSCTACNTICNGDCQSSACFGGGIEYDPDCDALGTSGGECCGNNRIDPGETCDNQNTGSTNCSDFYPPYTSGSLSCLPNCSDFDPTTCSTDPICRLYGCEPGECGPGSELCLADCSMTDCCGTPDNLICNLFIDDCTCSDCFGEQGPCPEGEICDSTGSGTCIDVEPPGNPINLTAMAGDAQARLDWINPSDSDLAGLMIRYNTGAGPAPINRLDGSPATTCSGYSTVSGTATNCIHTGLTNETQYNYSIFAFDEVPNDSSAASASVTPSTSTCNDNLTCEAGETCFCPDCEGETGNCPVGKKCQAGSCETYDSDCDGGFPDGTCDFPSETCSCIDCEDKEDPCPSGQGCHNGACTVIDLDCAGDYENGVRDSGEECNCGDHPGCRPGEICCPPCAVSCDSPFGKE